MIRNKASLQRLIQLLVECGEMGGVCRKDEEVEEQEVFGGCQKD